MLQKLKEFYKNWRLAKAIDFLSKSTVVFSGCALAVETANELMQPKVAYAEPVKKYESLATKFLDMEHDLGVMDENYKNLDNIIDEAKKTIKTKKKYSEMKKKGVMKKIDILLTKKNVVYKINTLLSDFLYPKKLDKEIIECFEKNGMGYLSSSSVDSLECSSSAKEFIKDNFRKRKHIAKHIHENFYVGDCDNFSMVYMALAKELKLPLYVVKGPEHVFVRWDEDGKHDALNPKNPVNEGDFNWETTGGEEWNDKEYALLGKIPEKSMNNVFLRNLKDDEILAIQYLNIGDVYYKNKKTMEAMKNLTKAVELNPTYFEAHFNLGNIYYGKEQYEKAIEEYDWAIGLHSSSEGAHLNIGVAYESKGDFRKAMESYNTALKIKPEYSKAINHKKLLLEKLNKMSDDAQKIK